MTSGQTYLVALGANLPSDLGPPQDTLHAALAELPLAGAQVIKVSRFFRTPCFPAGAGPDYVNAAAMLCFQGDADALLQILHNIEANLGRNRDTRWGARVIDLDLLAGGDQVLPNRQTYAHWHDLDAQTQMQMAPDTLILPHPRLHERAFVLVPLSDVAPGWRHPILGQTVDEMLKRLENNDVSLVQPL